ncbi:MAG: hypothetical protein Q7U35_08445 [Methanobacteriaceae archaeon]|nr:hypothetical protein [Methanobacteriaceae archaeon]MDP2836169.1 hypothetical protein [Methanobacteriaceae archaeon]MDP3035471.1 hypothetical protein [Methanobacteriaceae archaeon]MDP3486009.1 hypothetical protein [Methanobacteriaceae archaeon]MDP3622947.1 hypothetical protein [Methanobacteriaceae archaeon]
MSKAKNTSLKLKSISELISLITIIFGILVIIGWTFNIDILLSPGEGFSTIKTNVGLGFVLIGFALYLLQDKRNNKSNKQLSQLLSVIVFLIGFLTLFYLQPLKSSSRTYKR